jgi:hypothetical protein
MAMAVRASREPVYPLTAATTRPYARRSNAPDSCQNYRNGSTGAFSLRMAVQFGEAIARLHAPKPTPIFFLRRRSGTPHTMSFSPTSSRSP